MSRSDHSEDPNSITNRCPSCGRQSGSESAGCEDCYM